VLRAPRHPYTRGLVDSMPSSTAPGRDLAQIPGMPPSLLDPPPGCAFRPRCTRASERCAEAPETTAAGLRSWRCHHPLDEARA
jgi:peptide/nickel transport system ATP-binding protein